MVPKSCRKYVAGLQRRDPAENACMCILKYRASASWSTSGVSEFERQYMLVARVCYTKSYIFCNMSIYWVRLYNNNNNNNKVFEV